MADRNAPRDSGALSESIPLARILLSAALLAGLSGLLGLNAVLAMIAPHGDAQTADPARAVSAAPAPAESGSRTDSSVPDAATVFAARPETFEEPVPTF